MDNLLLEQLRVSWKALADKPEETPESTLKALYHAAAGTPLSAVKAMTESLPELDRNALERLRSLVERRCAGIPLAHLTERQQFMGIEMLANPSALIPRLETEIMGYEALKITKSLAEERGPLTIVDVCTGSGNIVLGIISHDPRHRGYGSDLSDCAVNFARQNAKHLGLDSRVEFRTGDLLEPFRSPEFLGNIDIITCNPPYISSRKVKTLQNEISQHEPEMAFDGGPFGVTILTRLVHDSPKFLKPASFLCFEVGLGQGPFVERMLRNSNHYAEIYPVSDNAGQVRAFVVKT